MNELVKKTEKTATTKQVAETLGCTVKTVLNNVEKFLPNKVVENGKPVTFTEAEVTVLLEGMKNNKNNQHDLERSLQGISTKLTPALKIKQAMLLMQEGYEEEIYKEEDSTLFVKGRFLETFLL